MMADEIVILSKKELEEIVFKASSKACSNLYNGLAQALLYPMERDMRTILAELDDIRRGG